VAGPKNCIYKRIFGICQMSCKANSEYQFLKHSCVFTELVYVFISSFLASAVENTQAFKLKSSKMTFVICLLKQETAERKCLTGYDSADL
jgi:hypothetical protein